MTGSCLLFMGAKDGVGATTCTVTFAAAWQQQGHRVVVCDWDGAHSGDVAEVLGQSKARTIDEVYAQRDRCTGSALLGYCGGNVRGLGVVQRTVRPMAIGSADGYREAAVVLTTLAQSYDTICIDGGSRIDMITAAAFQAATHVILVVRPEFSVTQAAGRCLATWQNAFVPRHRIFLLCNQWGDGAIDPTVVRERLAVAHWTSWPMFPNRVSHGMYGAPSSCIPTEEHAVAARCETIGQFLRATAATPLGRIDLQRLVGAMAEPIVHLQSPPSAAISASLRDDLLAALHEQIESRRIVIPGHDHAGREQLRAEIERLVVALMDQMPPERLGMIDRAALLEEVLHYAIGLGPLEPLLRDPAVSEIMVNGPRQIYVERAGRLERTDIAFATEAQLMHTIERIVAPMGRRVDESTPMVDVRLPDGSRVHIVLPPLALTGPALTIRRFPMERLNMETLIANGSVEPTVAHCLQQLVSTRRNLVVSGGTGTGKTTLLNILSASISPAERVVTIEDAAELHLAQPHVVRLEARPPNIEGCGAITIRDLVRTALRMRPDRIVVGECRGGEALDMLQAMNTGHDGSLTTIHANSPRDCIGRLETLVMFSGMELPSRAIREQIASAIHYIVQLTRGSDGRRRVTEVARVMGIRDDAVVLEAVHV